MSDDAALRTTAPRGALRTLADLIEDALPQTQCTRCGYPDCRRYAEAIAGGEAAINRCPPGGAEGITRGTGSEVSPNAILLDEADHLKKGVVSPYLFQMPPMWIRC